jgi:hypothetical protein
MMKTAENECKFTGDAMFSGFYVISHLFSHAIFLNSTVAGFFPVLTLYRFLISSAGSVQLLLMLRYLQDNNEHRSA